MPPTPQFMNRLPNPYHRIPSVHERIGQSISVGGIRSSTDGAKYTQIGCPFMNGVGKAHQEVPSVHERIGQTTSGGGIRS